MISMRKFIPILFLIPLMSCLELPEVDPNAPSDPNAALIVPDGFDFDMTSQQEVSLVAIDENGEKMSRIQFYIFSAPPEEGGVMLHRGLTNEEGVYRAKVQVSTHQEAIYAYTPYLDLVRAQRLELKDEPIVLQWGLLPAPIPGAVYKTAIDTTFGCDPSFYHVMGSYLKKLDVISGTYMTMGAASSNYNGIGYNYEDGMIYGFKKINNFTINLWQLNPNGVESDMGPIAYSDRSYIGGNFKGDFDLDGNLYSINGLNWGRLNVDSLPLTAYQTTLTNLNDASTNVHDIAYNKAFDKFYTVSKGGEFIVIDHVAGTIEKLADYGGFTGTSSGFGAVWCISSGEVFFSQNTTGNIYVATLDESGLPNSVALQLVGESAENNDGAGCVEAASPFVDQDGDGIPNGNDDYPGDPEVAFATYTPDKISYGTYAFEDFWPRKGDYDFNDIVIGYNYETARDTNNKVVWMTLNLRLKAIGGSFQSGFGISFDGLDPSAIESVTGTSTSSISVAANGCENGQTDAVIIVFDNAHKAFGVSNGSIVNTGKEGVVQVEPVDFQIKITFTEPIVDYGNINPFIFTRGERGREIHMMDNSPTDLATASLFNTDDDASTGGKYYVDSRGFPWAMNFPIEFSFPKEQVSVRASYTQFDNWVKSAGASQTDWYRPENALVEKVISIE